MSTTVQNTVADVENGNSRNKMWLNNVYATQIQELKYVAFLYQLRQIIFNACYNFILPVYKKLLYRMI